MHIEMHHKKVERIDGVFLTQKKKIPQQTQPHPTPPTLDPPHKNRQPQHREDKTQLATFPYKVKRKNTSW